MHSYQALIDAMVQLVRDGDSGSAMAVLGVDGVVPLPEGEVPFAEALDYAQLLFQLGLDEGAREVVAAVLTCAGSGWATGGPIAAVA